MPQPKDYYELLGLPRNASVDAIRKAYFKAARQLHPDRNEAPGETELFLDIQEAYEVLADPQRRAQYDTRLPPGQRASLPVVERILYSRQTLLRLKEQQLVYVLLNYAVPSDGGSIVAPPLNLCLVLDRSTSMRGANMDMVKATAIQIMRRLRPQDTFSVVAFSDRAETVIPATHNSEPGKLEARIQMLQTGGGTEIFQGLDFGFTEVQRNLKRGSVNHIILLTDGRTYGDEEQCLKLAEMAAAKGVGISGLGIGHDWNDALLDDLAKRTGGSSIFVAQPQEIEQLLIEKFNHLWQVYAEETSLEFELPEGVKLCYAFRLQPEAGLLTQESPIRLGPILHDQGLRVLMEFLIGPQALQKDGVIFLEGQLSLSILALTAQPEPLPVRLRCGLADKAGSEPPPPEVVEALSRLTLYRLQEQARLEAEAGDIDQASRHLERLATHLLERGERGLAKTVMLEAENLKKDHVISKAGGKQIKYGTRSLLMAGTAKDKI
ncbi:MAG: VWA domain-containing protein [Anaerolineales bacterium]|nr:VWA domain-containing protein [Anaerolineales bacterium]